MSEIAQNTEGNLIAFRTPLVERRYKLDEVYILWNSGSLRVIPKSRGVPQWADRRFLWGERGFIDPAYWGRPQLADEFLKLLAVVMAWPGIDAAKVHRELGKIDEYLSVIDKEYLADEWCETMKLRDALLQWTDDDFAVVSKARIEPTESHEDPCDWDQSNLAQYFLLVFIKAALKDIDAHHVYGQLDKIEEFQVFPKLMSAPE